MGKYRIKYYKKAAKQIKNVKAAKLDKRVKDLIDVLKEDPFTYPPSYEKLQ